MRLRSRRPFFVIAAAVVLATVSCGGDPNGAAKDVFAPEIVDLQPGDGAVGSTDTRITVTFSEPVDPAKVTQGVTVIRVGGGPITGTVSVDGNTVTFTPSVLLNIEASYTVTVTTAISDLAGNALKAPRTWTFRTPSRPPPPHS